MRLLNILLSVRPWLLTAGLAFVVSVDVSKEVSADSLAQRASVLPLEVSLQRTEGQSRRHFTERCSAFFVGHNNKDAVLISAWHCIDGQLSFQRQPVVSVQGQRIEVTIIDSGHTMDKDWLLMKAPSVAFSSLVPIEISRRPVDVDESLVAIGWGRQSDLSDAKPTMVECPVTHVKPSLSLRCGLAKGDSGGVVARRIENGQLEAVGVISSGDSVATTLAYPLSGLPKIFD